MYDIFVAGNRSGKAALRMNAGILALWVATAGAPVMAQDSAKDAAKKVEFDIQADNLEDALKSYSLATDRQVMFSTDIVERKPAKPVAGQMTADEALVKLLDGSGLIYEATPSSNVILVRAPQQQAMLVEQPMRIAQAQPEDVRVRRAGGEREQAEGDERKRDEITVTGTLIKGIAPESSPSYTFDRNDIFESGAASTEDFIRRTLPQNFGGGTSEFAPGGIPSESGGNNSFGTGANLRGLGAGATLTLLNGYRLAPSSTVGEYVDLSMIPVSALERIDVLTDGASSIYGSDAVAGVINFVLRSDFEGAETSARYGTVTSGGMDEVRVSQTAGAAWASGNVLATYEYFHRNNLLRSDRPTIAAPTFYDGTPAPDEFEFDLLPEQRRHSALLTINQDIAANLRASISGFFSHRESTARNYALTTSANYLLREPTSENFGINAAITYDFTPRWSLQIDGNVSDLRTIDAATRLFPAVQSLPTRVAYSDLWSVSALLNGVLIDLPAGDVKVAIGTQYRHEDFLNRYLAGGGITADGSRKIAAAFGELYIPIFGEANELPGVKRLEVNISGRLDDYSDFGTTINPKIGVLWSPATGLKLRGSYSTSYAPPALGRVYDQQRALLVIPYTLLRNLLGIELPDPSLSDINYMGANGAADDLQPEESTAYTFGADYQWNSQNHAFQASVTYYDVSFEGRLGEVPIPGNLTSAEGVSLAFEDPNLFPPGSVIFFPSDEQVQSVVEGFGERNLSLLGISEIENIGIIDLLSVTRNLASTETRGIDLNISYEFDTDFGRVSAGINANYILDFIRQAADTTPAVESVNSLYNPVDLKLRGRLGYAHDNFSSNLFVNYTDSYRTDSTSSAEPIESWTTLDFSVAYSIENSDEKWLNGTKFGLSIVNIFDEMPPTTSTLGAFRLTGYDPANASPVGRYISFDLRKSF